MAEHEPRGFHDRRRWAGRLAFPAAAVAVLLAWQGFESANNLWWVGAAAMAAVALLLLKARG